jgi:metallophosphoesterase (TIGR00282 family)
MTQPTGLRQRIAPQPFPFFTESIPHNDIVIKRRCERREKGEIMRILFIGDVVGDAGCGFLTEKLRNLRTVLGADLVVANGENAAPGNGILPASARAMFEAGVDIITGGNHTWQRREVYTYLEDTPYILRPANYPSASPGVGYCRYELGIVSVCVISLLGTVYMDAVESPFAWMDRNLPGLDDGRTLIFVDFHAEATSEKKALGWYLDGRVAGVFGTHTHVQTADEEILPGGTGYITDLGMTGVSDSILGVNRDEVIQRFVTGLPVRFKHAKGACELQGVLVDTDPATRKTTSIQRLRIQ